MTEMPSPETLARARALALADEYGRRARNEPSRFMLSFADTEKALRDVAAIEQPLQQQMATLEQELAARETIIEKYETQLTKAEAALRRAEQERDEWEDAHTKAREQNVVLETLLVKQDTVINNLNTQAKELWTRVETAEANAAQWKQLVERERLDYGRLQEEVVKWRDLWAAGRPRE